MRLIRLLYLSCLFMGYLLLTAGPAAAATLDQGAPVASPLRNSTAAQASTPTARVLTFDADVNPVTAAYVKRGIQLAEADGNSILVIQLNTPGGQLDSMEQITQDILNSRVPVMV